VTEAVRPPCRPENRLNRRSSSGVIVPAHRTSGKEMVMPYTLRGGHVPIRMWTDPAGVESGALDQLRNVANLPWVHGVAVMPDVHYGKGATVGSVIAMRNAVSPAAVGVDIGCGMAAVKTSLKVEDLPDNLPYLR